MSDIEDIIQNSDWKGVQTICDCLEYFLLVQVISGHRL